MNTPIFQDAHRGPIEKKRDKDSTIDSGNAQPATTLSQLLWEKLGIDHFVFPTQMEAGITNTSRFCKKRSNP